MGSMVATVESIGRDVAGQDTVRLRCPPASLPRPGQPMLACQQASSSALVHTLYPIAITAEAFTCRLPQGERWLPADQVGLRGPIGPGFQPPIAARRWLLVAPHGDAGPLLPLMTRGLDTGVALTLAGHPPVAGLPPEVEVATEPEGALAWADYVALLADRQTLAATMQWLDRHAPLGSPPAELLLLDRLACGFGACGACSLRTGHGWRWLCQDGPVFALGELRG